MSSQFAFFFPRPVRRARTASSVRTAHHHLRKPATKKRPALMRWRSALEGLAVGGRRANRRGKPMAPGPRGPVCVSSGRVRAACARSVRLRAMPVPAVHEAGVREVDSAVAPSSCACRSWSHVVGPIIVSRGAHFDTVYPQHGHSQRQSETDSAFVGRKCACRAMAMARPHVRFLWVPCASQPLPESFKV